MMVGIIALRFIASIDFGSHRVPEDHNDRDLQGSGRRHFRCTIDSLAQLKYDDKRDRVPSLIFEVEYKRKDLIYNGCVYVHLARPGNYGQHEIGRAHV